MNLIGSWTFGDCTCTPGLDGWDPPVYADGATTDQNGLRFFGESASFVVRRQRGLERPFAVLVWARGSGNLLGAVVEASTDEACVVARVSPDGAVQVSDAAGGWSDTGVTMAPSAGVELRGTGGIRVTALRVFEVSATMNARQISPFTNFSVESVSGLDLDLTVDRQRALFVGESLPARLSIVNRGGSELKFVSFDGPPDSTQFHVCLKFPPGSIPTPKGTQTSGWAMVVETNNTWIHVYLKAPSGATLPSECGSLAVLLEGLGEASGRSDRVEVWIAVRVSGHGKEVTASAALTVVRRSGPPPALAVGLLAAEVFVTSPADGAVENELELRLTSVIEGMQGPLVFQQGDGGSEIAIEWDVVKDYNPQTGDPREWGALCTAAEAHDVKVSATKMGLQPAVTDTRAVATLRPSSTFPLDRGQAITVTISNLTTRLPRGIARLTVRVTNVAGCRDTELAVDVRKVERPTKLVLGHPTDETSIELDDKALTIGVGKDRPVRLSGKHIDVTKKVTFNGTINGIGLDNKNQVYVKSETGFAVSIDSGNDVYKQVLKATKDSVEVGRDLYLQGRLMVTPGETLLRWVHLTQEFIERMVKSQHKGSETAIRGFRLEEYPYPKYTIAVVGSSWPARARLYGAWRNQSSVGGVDKWEIAYDDNLKELGAYGDVDLLVISNAACSYEKK